MVVVVVFPARPYSYGAFSLHVPWVLGRGVSGEQNRGCMGTLVIDPELNLLRRYQVLFVEQQNSAKSTERGRL